MATVNVRERITHREGRRCIIVKDQSFALETFEVNDDVPSFSRGSNETSAERDRVEWHT